MTPAGTAAFWLVAGALAALITVHVIFWTNQSRNVFLSRADEIIEDMASVYPLYCSSSLRFVGLTARSLHRSGSVRLQSYLHRG
jgi:hypothetical protein